MSPRELPDRPNLEQLKKQAKSLLHAAQQNDPDARRRFLAQPPFSKLTATFDLSSMALHDAQSVIAREHGFASWNALREEVEARSLSFDQAVDEFLRCASDGASGRANRLLALHPRIATANFQTALVLGDTTAVAARLREQPELATAAGGPQRWEPIFYVCHTCVAGDRLDALVAIAKQLLERGANPNAEYHWNWHPELPRTVLWAALCTVRHLPLARVLLAAGAHPTDGVSAHIAGGGGNVAALELLHEFGMNPDGIPGGVPPLVYMMTFATDPAGPRWLIDHGADCNLSWGVDDEAPLHVAARRWDPGMADALVAHGADVNRRRQDGRTPYTIAELQGNVAVAAWLRAQGATDDLSPLERFIAACARGDDPAARALRADDPSLPSHLLREHHLMLQQQAESGRAAILATMLSNGFNPNVGDHERVTPLHRAAMAGHPEAARVLLAHGADVGALDGMFAGSPLIWAVEGRTHAQPGADHVAVARLLIAAGSPLTWTPPPGAPGAERTLEGLADLRAMASRTAS